MSLYYSSLITHYYTMPHVVASIEARMGSSRFPGKVLADICGQPALTRLVRRLQRCQTLDGIILATSVAMADDALEKWANSEGVAIHRGSEEDVLLRVVEAQRKMQSEVVVEITGDCILLDPEIIDMGVVAFLENDCDVVSNTWKLSFPMGVDVQVYRLRDLEEIERTIFDSAVREHVSLYFYEHLERYRVLHLFAPARWRAPDYRFQLDYPEDHRFITEVYSRLEPKYDDGFGIEEIMSLLRQEPHLVEINRHCVEKSVR
ncbi:MAG: glycosyltransferase family protein [Nitrososphaera sp.]|nr:glycosyltransferase family protein [Nitrososphaera sp.]